MFFKKKKPDAPAEHPAIAPEQSASGQSKFAPGLNVTPSTQIDFGFSNFAQEPSAGYPQAPSTSFDPWSQPPQGQGLDHETLQSAPLPVLPPMGEPDWSAPQPIGPAPITGMPPLETGYPVQTGVDQFNVDQVKVDQITVDQSGVVYSMDAQLEAHWAPPMSAMPQDAMAGPMQAPPQAPMDFTDYVPPVAPMPTAETINPVPLPAPVPPVSGNLSPEQAWSMLQPTQPAPLLPDEAADFAVPGFDSSAFSAAPESSLSPAPLAPMESIPAGVQDDWANAFENPVPPLTPHAANESLEWSVDAAPSHADPLSPHYEIPGATLPMGGFPESLGAQADMLAAATGSAFVPHPPASFDSADDSETPERWSDAALSPDGFATGFSTETEPSTGFSDFGSPGEPLTDWGMLPEATSAPLPQDLGAMANADAAPTTSLDALWNAPQEAGLEFHGDLPSTDFNAPLAAGYEAAPSGAPAWDITEPQLPAMDMAPTYQPSIAPDNGLPPFDPMQASQELAAGWSQVEHASQALEPAALDWEEDEVSPLSVGMDWANAPGAPPEPVYFHEQPTSPQAGDELWNNLGSAGLAPGEQVPYTSGAMMDSINEQLYPEDPFSSVNDEFSAGEQAFAEAAKYLFPETVSAPLDWSDSGYGSADSSESTLFGDDDDEGVSVLNLGPSYSAPNETFAELPASYVEPAAAYEASSQPEAFSGNAYQLPQTPEVQAATPYYQPSAIETPEEYPTATAAFEPAPAMPLESAYTAQPDFQSQQHQESMGSVYYPDSSAMLEPEPEIAAGAGVETAYGEPVIWTPDTVSTSGFASMESPSPETESVWESDLGSAAVWEESVTPLSEIPPPAQAPVADAFMPVDSGYAPPAVEQSQSFGLNEDLTGFSPSEMASLDEEADFYATAFTLNELGELVPVHEDEGSPEPNLSILPEAGSAAGALGVMPHSGPLPPAPAMPVPPVVQTPSTPPVSGPPVKPAFSPEQFLAASRRRFAHPENAVADMPAPSAPVAQNPVQPAAPPSIQPVLTPPQAPMAQAQPHALPETPLHQPAQPQPVHPVLPAAQAESLAESPAEAEVPKTIRPKPLNRKMPVIPSPTESQSPWQLPPTSRPEPPREAHPESPLESQWYSPDQPSTTFESAPKPAASTSAGELKLTLGNLEVVGICQLPSDSRLLVVHNDGVYALMGQNGQDSANVSVLKVFEHNPLAYQHTFTAVEEARAAGQGMYVTQVGTWHAIISTFQDKITLHTELG